MPRAKSNISTSPVKFIHDLGIGYRKLDRDKPIMDGFASTRTRARPRPARKGYAWPNAGVANLDRIKQAVWDAFHDTGQPTFAEPDFEQERPPTFKLDEVGWQVAIPKQLAARLLRTREHSPDDREGAGEDYSDLISKVACDLSVSELFFGLVDEPNLDRWQAGLGGRGPPGTVGRRSGSRGRLPGGPVGSARCG